MDREISHLLFSYRRDANEFWKTVCTIEGMHWPSVSVDKKERKEKKFSIFWREGGEEEEEEEFVYTEHYEIASF